MKLSEFVENPQVLKIELAKVRQERRKNVKVNSGIRSAKDIEAILDNKTTELVDWSPLYKSAEEFD